MSGESRLHLNLVEGLIMHVQCIHKPQNDLIVFSDIEKSISERPNRIGGYLPDVFASDFPTTMRLIAEAKTHNDLISARSVGQIEAFLDYLALYENSFFYLGVPTYSSQRAKSILREIQKPGHANISVEVVELNVGGLDC